MINIADITNTVIRADCLDIMRGLPDKCIDLVLTDPPYGIGMDGGNVGYRGFNDFKKLAWDKSAPPREYFDEIMRISKNQIIFGGNYFNLMPTRCFVVWDKGEGFYGRTYAECEYIWTSFDRNSRIIKRDPLANGDYRGKLHPTMKPEYVIKKLVLNFSTPGTTIFDPFAGSGTTAIACLETGRNYICIEKEPDYVEIINKRIAQWKEQGRLFA